MNDDFISRLRATPRPEFAEALYHRISQESRRPLHALGNPTPAKRLAWGLAALCLAFTLSWLGFPQVRAAVGEAVRRIGAIQVWETEEHPYPGGQVKVISPRLVSLAEAQNLFGDKLALPAWVPVGFTLKDEVQIYGDGDVPVGIELTWENTSSHRSIDLYLAYSTQDFVPTEIVGTGSVEEVLVNGEPAALVRGAWNSTTHEWGATELVHLHWAKGEVAYQLLMGEGTIPIEDLVRMAESME